MYQLTLTRADNARGSTPLVNLYRLISQQYPALGLTQANTKVVSLIGDPDALNPYRAYLCLARVGNPNATYEFHYNRLNVPDFFVNPVFSKAELPAILALPTSTALLAALAVKLNLNLTPDDFWVDPSGIEFAGGFTRPNWLLKSRFDSVFWCGELILHLN